MPEPMRKIKLKEVPIVIDVPEDMKSVFANYMLITHTDDEFFITFCEFVPPMLVDETALEKVTHIKARALVRVVIPATRMASFVKAISENFAKYAERHKE